MRDYLRVLRNNRGMSIDDVARVMGVTAASYSMIETGRRQLDMTLGTICKLAEVFNVPVEDIMRSELDYRSARAMSA